MKKNTPESLFRRTTRTAAGCLLWTGGRFSAGYGAIRYHGRMVSTHVAAWLFTRGDIPDGYFVAQRCKVRLCCEPEHLRLAKWGSQVRRAA